MVIGMREKMIELLDIGLDKIDRGSLPWAVEMLADYLIDNGVTIPVLCKDCTHWNCWRNSGEGSGDCLLDEGYQTLTTQHYDFCSYGERREGECT